MPKFLGPEISKMRALSGHYLIQVHKSESAVSSQMLCPYSQVTPTLYDPGGGRLLEVSAPPSLTPETPGRGLPLPGHLRGAFLGARLSGV